MQKNFKHTSRRFRAWFRSPRFFLRRAANKLIGTNDEFIGKNRIDYKPGSYEWLVLSENLFGGFQSFGAKWKVLDEIAEKPAEDVLNVGLGGDRMSAHYHGYGRCYAQFLEPFSTKTAGKVTLVEVGIFNGTGLAIWCDLFPSAEILGLDLDLSNFKANLTTLEQLGAFQQNQPELYPFDQLNDVHANTKMAEVLNGRKVDIAIDDGHHSIKSIEITFEALRPHLSESFVYFIEDNFDTYDHMARRYPQYQWHSRGELTVVTSRMPKA